MTAEIINELKPIFKIVVSQAGIFLAFLALLIDRCKSKRAAIWLMVALHLFAALAVAVYFEFGHWRYNRYINPHDVYHYYVGAKYSEELGYSDLYRATLVADVEQGAVFNLKKKIRNLDDYSFTPASQVLIEKEKYKALFTQSRWTEFKQDIKFFRSLMPASKWQKVLKDKGYNATPTWNMVARWLANSTSTDGWSGVYFLLSLDIILIVLMIGTVGYAYGYRVALFSLIFFAINFFMSFVTIKGAFLRLDWVALMVMSVCLLKLERFKTAGALAAYSVTARVFPLIFLFGLGAKAVWDLFKYRRIGKQYLEFFVTFVITIGVLVGISIAADGGIELWKTFFEKIGMHNDDMATTRVGFKYVFLDTWEQSSSWKIFAANKTAKFSDAAGIWWTIQAAVIALCFFIARKLDNDESIALGIVPVYFLTAPSYYYWVMLSVPFVVFAARLRLASRTIVVAMFFCVNLVAYSFNHWLPLWRRHCYISSWLLLALCVVIVISYLAINKDLISFIKKPKIKNNLYGPALGAGVGVILIALLQFLSFLEENLDWKNQPNLLGSPTSELILTGDVMFARGVARSLDKNNRDFSFLLKNTRSYISSADIAFCNFETAASEKGEKIDKKYTFNSDPNCIEALVKAGFDVVSLANNHTLDYGPLGLSGTVENLEKHNLPQVGLSHNDAPQEPIIITTDEGIKVGFLAYADPAQKYSYAREFFQYATKPAKVDFDKMKDDIASLKKKTDIIVASVHWGVEYKDSNKRQRKVGRFLVRQGVDIVAGHHPHVQQDAEWYRQSLIIYSMGNFIFDQRKRKPTREGRLYRVRVSKDGVHGAEFLPLNIPMDNWNPTPTRKNFIEVD